MADNEFAERAAQLAAMEIHDRLIRAQRDFEDAQRIGDDQLAAVAVNEYVDAKAKLDMLTPKPQQQNKGQLSVASRNFLSRRVAGGEELTPQRWQDYIRAHQRAVTAGWTPDTPEYFSAVAGHVDSQGDGRLPPLDEREAARISGVSEQEYAQNAQKLRALKARGMYSE